jgi:protein TonB
MTAEQRQNRIIIGFIILSLLLHLMLLLVPKDSLFPAENMPKPVYVEVRPTQQRDRELDLPPVKEPEKPRETPAKRLAEQDQIVEKETAPEGQDTEDRQKIVRAPKPAPKPAPPTQEQPQPRPETVPNETTQDQPSQVTPEGWQAKAEKRPLADLPDLQTLTQISPSALAQIESDWRRKYREDVTKGDTVWMDTEQDLLHSFMKRFRDNIYLVWHYPDAAAQRQQQGTCLVRITIDRQGNVSDIVILESSGHRILDDEVIRAVRQGATYGPLPRAYPNPDLKIMAFFQYHLSGTSSSSYRRRPGQIY